MATGVVNERRGRGSRRRRARSAVGRPVKVIALVKPFRAQAVLSALESVEILGGTVREAMGYGRQKNRLGQYLGSEYNTSFLPKVQMTVFVERSTRRRSSRPSWARRGRDGSATGRSWSCPAWTRA